MSAAPAYRLGRHPRRPDHPALLNADGTVAHTFAYNAEREEITASLEHAGLMLHADDTVTPDGDPAKEDGQIAASFAANRLPITAPKVIDLGKHLADAERAYAAFDAVAFRQGSGRLMQDKSDERRILDDRVEALRTLITTTPATSLADAAVLIAGCVTIASRLEASVISPPMLEDYTAQLERMLLSALPFVAEAAGLDLAAMDWADQDQLRIVRYAGVGVQS